MATRRKKTTTASTKGMTAADFMKQLSGAHGLISLNEKTDEFYPIGNPVIDRALGGGIQKGQMCCLRGAKSTGKSLISLTIARNVLEAGGNVAYFDTENKISQKAIRRMGLDKYLNTSFQFLTIDTQKDAIEIIMQMIDSGIFQLVVIDSINGLYTEEQAERDIHEESKVGGYQSKVWSEYLPMITQHAAENDVTIILVQQARDNLQSMYGSTETYSGGKAIDHFATTILRFGSNKKGNETVDGSIVRQGITIRIDKNNQGSLPDAPIEAALYVGDDPSVKWGIDELSGVVQEMIRLGIFAPKRKGASYYVPCKELCDALHTDEKSLTVNGRARVMEALANDEVLYSTIKDLISKANAGDIKITPYTDDVAVSFEDTDEDMDDADIDHDNDSETEEPMPQIVDED